jgi:MGT family glycosyltransferase
MEKRHIAVITPLVAGHVYPALAVCSELLKRGHRITYPTDGRLAATIRKAGAEAIEFTLPELRNVEDVVRDEWSDDARHWRAFTAVGAPMLLTTAAVTVAALEEFYATNPPDLILYDWFAFAGRILARQLGCPAVQVCAHFAHQDSLVRIDGVHTTPQPMRAFAHLLDSFMSTYGFSGTDHLWHVEELNIFFVPERFQPDAASFDDRFKFVGATHNRKPRPGAWKNRSEKGEALLLISENTGSNDDTFLRLCIEAFAESQYRVVFSKGLRSPEVSSALAPSNFEINREAFNCEILPFAKVMLCQGGLGTVLESLYHGVPVVAVPPSIWNAEVAYRLGELGLGVNVPARRVTARALRQAVDTAFFDEALRGRVRRMRDDLRINPGAEAAANAIEESLRKAPPTARTSREPPSPDSHANRTHPAHG